MFGDFFVGTACCANVLEADPQGRAYSVSPLAAAAEDSAKQAASELPTDLSCSRRASRSWPLKSQTNREQRRAARLLAETQQSQFPMPPQEPMIAVVQLSSSASVTGGAPALCVFSPALACNFS